jgi:hypothetical protein
VEETDTLIGETLKYEHNGNDVYIKPEGLKLCSNGIKYCKKTFSYVDMVELWVSKDSSIRPSHRIQVLLHWFVEVASNNAGHGASAVQYRNIASDRKPR